MRASILGAAAVGLVGIGLWLGRAASPPPDRAGAPSELGTITAPVAAAAVTPTRSVRTQAPVLPARRPNASPSVVPGLAADLVDPDPKVRRAAVREVVRGGDSDPAVLLVASRDPDLGVGMMATERLGTLYAEGAVPLSELVARATDHGLHEKVRITALNGIGIVANPDVASVLVELMTRGDLGERRSAAILLVHQDLALATPALIGALGDSDAIVQANALESLRARSRGRDFGSDAGAWRAWWQAATR